MAIADHFDPRPDAGFVRSYDLQAARRQFQVSLLLILVLGGAAIVLGLMTRFDPPNPPAHPQVLRESGSRIAQTLLDIRS